MTKLFDVLPKENKDRCGLQLLAFAFFILLLTFFTSCNNNSQEPVVEQDFVFSTVVRLTLYGVPENDPVFRKVFDRMADIDWRMSAQKPESEINSVSTQSGIKPVTVSESTFHVMQRALSMAQLSGGAFDPTIGPVVDLWGVGTDKAHVPKNEDIANAKSLVDWRAIVLEAQKNSIYLKHKGMKLDFGGVAKGYAADEAARIVSEAGVKSAILSMGDSSIRVFGKKPDGQDWKVGIQDPEPGADYQVIRGNIIGVVSCSDADVSTSGPYERFFVQDGKRYHHIMDPRTGKPADSGLWQVTLIMPANVDLPDGLSTSCFVKGLKDGMALVESIPGVAGVFVTSDKKVYVTSRIAGRFELRNPSYSLESQIN